MTSGIETDQPSAPHVDDHARHIAENTSSNDASVLSDAEHGAAAEARADGNDSQPTSLEQTFERKYDDLGPSEFADQVIRFGYWPEQQGRNLSPAEREHALAKPDANDDALGRALLEALARSRFIFPPDRAFSKAERYVQCYHNWQKDFMQRYGYKTKRDAYKNAMRIKIWIGVA